MKLKNFTKWKAISRTVEEHQKQEMRTLSALQGKGRKIEELRDQITALR